MRPIKLRLVGLFGFLSLSGAAQQVSDDYLGRLFFSQQERRELDRIRAGIGDGSELGLRTVKLEGIFGRNGGKATIWVNGRRYLGGEVAGATLTRGKDHSLVVLTPQPDPRSMPLKVGQTLDPAGGNLREVYQRPPQELNQLLRILAKRGPQDEKSLNKKEKTSSDKKQVEKDQK